MRFASIKIKILIIAIVVAFVLSLNLFQEEIKGFFYNISASIQQNFWDAGDSVAGFLETVGDKNKLKAENEELQKNIRDLLAEKASLIELKKENEILRDALQIGLQKDFQLALVEVIGKDIGQESILINQGLKDGLSLNMPVITQQKILLGKITEIYKNFSRVALISSKESSFDAKVSGADTTGVARGQGSLEIKLDLVPQDKVLRIDDLVVSSSLGGIYPKGLLVGVVKKISKNDVDPFYQAEISPFFDIRETSAVFVILNFTDD